MERQTACTRESWSQRPCKGGCRITYWRQLLAYLLIVDPGWLKAISDASQGPGHRAIDLCAWGRMYQIFSGLRRTGRCSMPLQAVYRRLMQLDLASPCYATSPANPFTRAGRGDVLSGWRKHHNLINLHRWQYIQSFESGLRLSKFESGKSRKCGQWSI
jgi:hypothetical protein